MAIRIPIAPTQSLDALRSELPSLATRSAMTRVAPRLAAALTSERAASATPVLSYPVYTLGLNELGNAAQRLSAAKPSLWRHVLSFDGELVTADTVVDSTGAKLSALNINSAAAAVQAAIHTLSQDGTIASASYEAGLLQVPALGVRAVWLHDPAQKSPDILVPVPPVRPELVAGRHYTVAEFANALKDAATRALANDDPQKGSG
ncbi:MAG TPA: hypothetical protein VHX17_08890 [Candidatus Cybelea sp.]|jgi:hypothetical protein|nr:hypothetical protein [Candidatus Cybelea sp.]